MAVTIKCSDCGHAKSSEDGEPETCPQCEGTMTASPKKKPTSVEDEDRPKKKAKSSAAGDEPSKKKPARAKGGNPQDESAAKRAGIPSGLDDADLVAQVEEELEAGEILQYTCRPARKLAQLQAVLYAGIAGIFVLVPGLIGISMLRNDKGTQALLGLIPLGVAIAAGGAAVLAPRGRMRQAARGWYAVTDRRAIVFEVPLLGGKGTATEYAPDQLRKMWVRKSLWLKGGGDVVFKTVVQITTMVSDRSEKTEKSTQHYGFIGIENVEAVRDVIEWAVLSDERPGADEEE